ncbi:MAG: TPM domain-containing protein [Alcanivorax sp.]|jgi:putative membrane protein|uniref:TPM domain-containing protein n=1 Tax=Alcanivorax sp. TaxID=1872427 RepID=UPI0019B6949D|nr:TPM domain-containing protein [Alcanivorax sp.]MBD3643917.1 TPM domain-containing protein [Alcanivorax sp.]MDF1725289.1 TPM domain-containing protein [Alcanivorax sp.]
MLLDKNAQETLSRTIGEQEKRTDAELVTVLARQADDYRYVTLLWAALLSLLVPAALLFLPVWLTPFEGLLLQWGVLLVLAVLFRLKPVQFRVVPRRLQRMRAAGLARQAFLEQGLHRTRGGTGLLIFVSEAEHYVEILADQGIARHVDDSEWQTIVDAFIARVKAGRVAEGFQECVAACGDKLATHVPATEQKNELPNHLIVL